MSRTPLQAVRGMNDVLPDEAEHWEAFEAIIRDWLAGYGYRPIRMPLVEPTPLFKRAIGEVTDIVEKEMYSFEDALNGEKLTLRPEGTASCVRAAIQHNLLYDSPRRLWYSGPMFRHERPQKGRYRQFHQVGVEALGYAGPDIDIEMIMMTRRLWQRLGLTGIRLEINTLGDSAARAAHRAKLVSYLEQHIDRLDDDAKRRLYTNPLRVLDSKNPQVRAVVAVAPRLEDALDAAARAHFAAFRDGLELAGIEYTVNPNLVRGLDYYNYTVFEWITDQLGAQGTVCAGGRYDGLIEQIGGKPAPACGYAMGVERLLALMEGAGTTLADTPSDAYIIRVGQKAEGFGAQLAEQLRDAGLHVSLHCGGGSFKSQMKKADASGARFALIVGDDEAATGRVAIKPLRGGGGQRSLAPAEAIACLRAGSAGSDPSGA
jgi:histidyl-tRNA synthetase